MNAPEPVASAISRLRDWLCIISFRVFMYINIKTRVRGFDERIRNNDMKTVKRHNTPTMDSRLTAWLLLHTSSWARNFRYIRIHKYTKSLRVIDFVVATVQRELQYFSEKHSPKVPTNELEYIQMAKSYTSIVPMTKRDWYSDKPFDDVDSVAGLEWFYEESSIWEYTKVKCDPCGNPIFTMDTSPLIKVGPRHPDYVPLGAVVKLKLVDGHLRFVSINKRKCPRTGEAARAIIASKYFHLGIVHQIGHRMIMDICFYLQEEAPTDSFVCRLLSPILVSDPYIITETSIVSVPYKSTLGMATPLNGDNLNKAYTRYNDEGSFTFMGMFDMWTKVKPFCHRGDYSTLERIFCNTTSHKHTVMYWKIIEKIVSRFVNHAFKEHAHAKYHAKHFVRWMGKVYPECVCKKSLKTMTKRLCTPVLASGFWHEMIFSQQINSQLFGNPRIIELFPKYHNTDAQPLTPYIRTLISKQSALYIPGTRYIDIDGRYGADECERDIMLDLADQFYDMGTIIPINHQLHPTRIPCTLHQGP